MIAPIVPAGIASAHLRARLVRVALVGATVLSAGAAQAQTTGLYGGVASTSTQQYAGPNAFNSAIPTAPGEMYLFDTANPSYGFQLFYTTSAKAQAAFAGNNPSALGYAGSSPLPPSINYAGSESPLAGASGTTVNGFTYTTVAGIPGVTADYATRASKDGALIQIPMLGVGLTIPALSGNPNVPANGTLKLTDNDLCGIFSGKITDWGDITHPITNVSGPITVVYRPDSAGTTVTLTNHFKYTCNAGNSSFPNLGAAPTSTFPNLFNGTVPGNFSPVTSVSAAATALAGTVTASGGKTVGQAPNPSAITWLGADFTAISANGRSNTIAAATPPGGFINSRKLFVASIDGVLPSVANIKTALAHPGANAVNPAPPTGAATTNPLNWVPIVPTPAAGYPLVSTSNFILAQCYADPNVAAGFVSFLQSHYDDPSYKSQQGHNGFARPPQAYINAVKKFFLTPTSSLAINQAGQANCAGATGR